MVILERAFKRRGIDGKLMQLGKVFDYDNTYRYNDETGKQMKFIPVMWIILGVYDYEFEIV